MGRDGTRTGNGSGVCFLSDGGRGRALARPGGGGTFGETEAGARPGVSAGQPPRPLGTARVPRWTPVPLPSIDPHVDTLRKK